MVLGRCFQKFFRKSEPVWNYLSSNKCPDFHELFFNLCFLAARVCGQVSEWLWAVQQDSSRGAPLEIPGKGFTAFHLRNGTKIPQFCPKKRGLTSGIDPGIHFQRPWNDSEAWQGSVTTPPSPCELGGGWGRDPPSPPFWGGSGSTNPLGIEHHIPATLRQVLLHPQRKMQQRSIPHPRLEFIRGVPSQAKQGTFGKWGKIRSRARSVEKFPGSLRSPAPCRGLRCSAVGAAPPEPLRSLSAPDAIARQQLPVHLQFYP